METPQLTLDSHFWDQAGNTALLNPRTQGVAELRRALEHSADRAGLSEHCIFATSGTTGVPKFACLARRALLASAAAVNAHLHAVPKDRWFCALPLFHVGGVGVWARAHLLGCSVSSLEGRWNARNFRDQLAESGSTLSAIVPTQVYDLVTEQCRCPVSVRAVLVGGGALTPSLRNKAHELGWPLLETFGMTEAASQIATQPMEELGREGAGLQVLPEWEVRNAATGSLEIRGDALFSGYLIPSEPDVSPSFSLVRATSKDGWFSTNDRVRLWDADDSMRLIPLRRTDETVKILGENVDVGAIQASLDPIAATVVVTTIPDPRTGARLVAAIETESLSRLADVEALLRDHNAMAPPYQRVSSLAVLPTIPRSELGKVANHQLVSALIGFKKFRDVN